MTANRFFMERLEDRNHVMHDMKVLYPAESAVEKTRRYFKDKKKIFLLILAGGILLAGLLELSSFLKPVLLEDNSIRRGAYATDGRLIHLNAYYQDGAEKEEILLQVSERQYTATEVEEMLSEVTKLLPDVIKGENRSLNEVRKQLKLVKKIEGYPFHIRWQPDNYRLLNQYGVIQSEAVSEEGSKTQIKAVITYKDYQADRTFDMKIFPPVRTEQEAFIEQLHTEVEQREADSVTDAELQLPEQVAQKEVIWREQKNHTSLYLLLLAAIAAAVIYYGKDTELHKQVEQRKKEMEMDYAEIVSKLTLFLGAGMTTRGAWKKIVTDYQEVCSTRHMKRYAYEEMAITYNEMCSGVSEIKAYERFGRRVELPHYQVLASIIGQGVKRGTQRVAELLRKEMTDAFEERKSIAKQLGEEAGTKLMLPMFMMLAIVMLMIMLPAFLSLQGVS